MANHNDTKILEGKCAKGRKYDINDIAIDGSFLEIIYILTRA